MLGGDAAGGEGDGGRLFPGPARVIRPDMHEQLVVIFWVDGRGQGSPLGQRTQPASHCSVAERVYPILQSHQWDWSSMGNVDNTSSHISHQVPQVSHGWLGVSLRSLRQG